MTQADISQKLDSQCSELAHYNMSAAMRMLRKAAKGVLAKLLKPLAGLVVSLTIDAVEVPEVRVAFVELAATVLVNITPE